MHNEAALLVYIGVGGWGGGGYTVFVKLYKPGIFNPILKDYKYRLHTVPFSNTPESQHPSSI